MIELIDLSAPSHLFSSLVRDVSCTYIRLICTPTVLYSRRKLGYYLHPPRRRRLRGTSWYDYDARLDYARLNIYPEGGTAHT